MAVAGALLIADHSWWPYFGLVGGGMYLYFSGRGILTRLALQRRGFRIGAARNIQAGYALLGVWGAMAAITIGAASAALS
jgi:hypothetical protein